MYDIRRVKDILKFEDVAYFETIDSTNLLAREMARSGKSDFLIVAEKQVSGRGRHGRKWVSEEGGVYFSFGISAESIPYQQQLFSLTAALGVMNFLKEQQAEGIEYRWPNDILVNGRKICGILCELIDKTLIAGIGFNVNNESFSGEIEKTATSLFMEKRMKHREEYVLVELVSSILKIAGNAEALNEFIRNNPMRGKKVSVKTEEKTFSGTVSGIGHSGELVVDCAEGEMRFFAGDVELLREV